MNYSTNYNLNKPERSEQFNIDHWNNNTDAIDTQMHTNEVNIAQNATDIATLFTGLNTKNTSDTNSVFYKLMKLIYPVGSLYWSANNTNPSTLFGGTWTQIKDKFVLACGDTYSTTGATGGASSVTLTVNNLPSHNHSIGGSTGETQPTFAGTAGTTGAGTAHSHGLNSHTHKVTASGNISVTANPTFSGTSHAYGWRGWSGGYPIDSLVYTTTNVTAEMETLSNKNNGFAETSGRDRVIKMSWTDGGTISGGTYKFTGTEVTSGTATGNTATESAHTHSFTPSGTVSSHSHTLPANTGSKGSGTAFDIMPPYIVKYCWQRTA